MYIHIYIYMYMHAHCYSYVDADAYECRIAQIVQHVVSFSLFSCWHVAESWM